MLFPLLVALFHFPTLTAALLNEKQILEHLYHNLNGDNWDITWDISTTTDICSADAYPGVICDTTNTHVIEIELADNNLVGSITPHLYTMPHLKKVDFSKNGITNAGWDRIDLILDETPDAVVNMLQVMDLTNNRINSLEGIEQLKDSLTGLHMTYNNLKGGMADHEQMFQLHKLQVLAISENELTGLIDTRIGTMVNLQELYCYGNKITGEIPSEIGKLTKMQILTLAENHLSGPLPSEIKNMGNLQTFSVHNNGADTGAHTGPLPKFDTHPYLSEIYLDGNAFVGEIPHLFLHMFNQTDVEVNIGLSNNQLSGTVPTEFLKFKSLNLNVVGNNITGLDSKICESKGVINAWMNGLVEQFGCDAIMCPVDFFAESGKQEEEDTPCKACAAGTGGAMGATACASEVDDISELEILAELYLACLGPQWDNATGWSVMAEIESPLDLTLPSFEGIDHCTFQGVTCSGGQVIELALPSNGLEGMVPPSLWDLPALQVLDLSGNELHLDRSYGFGDIGNAKNLLKADLSSNDIQKFTGIGASKSLQELYIDDAYFFSSLDEEVYQMTQLRILHMQYSGLKGKIPDGFSKMTGLRAFNFYGNELTGTIPTEIGLMPNLWHIDFSENDFTGLCQLKPLPN
eukprot:g4077.t1 g4077   contig15:289796-291788(+)